MSRFDASLLAVGAEAMVGDYMSVQRGEHVLVTADLATDREAIGAVVNSVRTRGARPAVLTIPQLPFQGSLADPDISDPVAAAVANCDVWFDMTFPYMAGSGAHSAAMKTKRVRSLLVGDLGSPGIARLFGAVDFDRLFAVQEALDMLIARSVGEECRFSNARGTDVIFKIARPATRKLRHTNQPGTYTPPGSAVIYPEPKSVRGRIVVDAAFHEWHGVLKAPITIDVDGRITALSGGGTDLQPMDRALRRASRGEYGSPIHFSHGFHPSARFAGASFIEDIRTVGCNAIGLGIPWWEEGGGENHPDAVITMQSLWIGGEQIVSDGNIVGPPEAARAERELASGHRPV